MGSRPQAALFVGADGFCWALTLWTSDSRSSEVPQAVSNNIFTGCKPNPPAKREEPIRAGMTGRNREMTSWAFGSGRHVASRAHPGRMLAIDRMVNRITVPMRHLYL